VECDPVGGCKERGGRLFGFWIKGGLEKGERGERGEKKGGGNRASKKGEEKDWPFAR